MKITQLMKAFFILLSRMLSNMRYEAKVKHSVKYA